MAALAFWALLSCANQSFAAEPAPAKKFAASSAEAAGGSEKVIKSIEVSGLKRIERDAVLNKIQTRVGGKIGRDSIRADIETLHAMGYFDDIEVQADPEGDGLRVTYVFKERPVVSAIEFDGNERLSESDLKEVTKIKEWSILDLNKVKDDVALIQKHYEDKGFYLAKVGFEIVSTKADEVKVVYKISDYDKVQIKKITFLNNQYFSDEALKGVLQETREGGLFTFLSGAGNFKENAFKTDLQRLTYWYLDRGYVKFRYENPVVTVSDDKRWLYISIYVDEGESYQMGTVGFGGDLLFTREELEKDLSLKPGDTFSISKRNQDIQRLTEKYQDLGYAFVNVVPKMNINDASKVVDIEYEFEKGSLVHFGEIIVLGNSKTHDKVIRRELKIKEGELYSGTKLRESRENVERLGYFAPGEVIFNTVSPKNKSDILNVEITIKERSTGTITLGAGYGSANGFFFQSQVSEINLFGKGQTVSLAAQLAAERRNKSFNFGFTDPYAFDTRWTTGFDLYYINFSIPDKYETRKLGFDVRLGYPIYEYTNLFLTYKNEGLKIIEPDSNIDQAELDADNGVLSSVSMQVIRDKRNNRFETTAGNYQSLSFETAGLGGTKDFLKWTVNNRFYKKIIGDLVFRTSAEYGQIYGLGGKRTPPSERFYLGGPNNLRGYDIFSVGPSAIRGVDGTSVLVKEPLGGVIQVFALFELEYPLVREAGLKWVVFYDAGNTFAGWPKGDAFKIRTDAGFGIRWFSPIGPLRFEFGYPFRKKPDERGNVFNFFIGTPF